MNEPEHPLEKLLEITNALAEGDDVEVRVQLSRLYPTLPMSEAIKALKDELWLHAEWAKRQIN